MDKEFILEKLSEALNCLQTPNSEVQTVSDVSTISDLESSNLYEGMTVRSEIGESPMGTSQSSDEDVTPQAIDSNVASQNTLSSVTSIVATTNTRKRGRQLSLPDLPDLMNVNVLT